ncbi:MAG: hypothetical protein AB7O80_00985 [Acetobacteraceae bacterium]
MNRKTHDPSGGPPGASAASDANRSDRSRSVAPASLPEWRAQADEDYALLHMVAQFLTKPDHELRAAATGFPRQVDGMRRRLAEFETRLATRLEAISALLDRLDAASGQPKSGAAVRLRPGDRSSVE